MPIGDGGITRQVVVAAEPAKFWTAEAGEDLNVGTLGNRRGEQVALVALGVGEEMLAGVKEGSMERLEIGETIASASSEII